ncbi:MAG: class I adenylate-forming enzyme family protein, partial [Actinomycetota bacterium]
SPYSRDVTLGQHNLARLAENAFERTGDRRGLFFEGTWYGTANLWNRTTRLARGFTELGIEPGDRVAVVMSNCPEVGISYGALWRAGAAITPAIFLLPPPELHHIFEDSGARAVITTPEFLPNVKQAAEGVESLKWIISMGPEENGVIPLSSLEEAEPGSIVDRDDDDLAALMYTGGTTGRAKGVALTHANLWFGAECGFEASHVEGIKRTIVPLPLSHSFGLIVAVVALHQGLNLTYETESVLMRWFIPKDWLELVQEHRIERGTVVPSMVQVLLAEPLEDYDLSSLRYLVSGASPLPVEAAEEFERRVPSVEILEAYGLTESGVVLSHNRPGARRLGSVGPPMPRVDVRIVDEEGNDVPQGELGEITCRSKAVMHEYWKAPDATEHALRDGWLYTGDIGRFDEDGYLYVVDRKKDLIIRGGFNVYPRDVEDALVEHPAVQIAGVVGKPDPTKGEEVVAFVMLRPDQEASAEDLKAFAKDRVGGKAYPRDIRIVDQVPLTPVGKIDRKALRRSC